MFKFFHKIFEKLIIKYPNYRIKKTIMEFIQTEQIQLQQVWEQNLKLKGVKLPKKGSLLAALTYLYENKNEYHHIDNIKKHVIEKGCVLTGSDPLQVRHLSTQLGWNVIKKGRFEHGIFDITIPCPAFIRDRRNEHLTDESWNNLKQEYGNMCVNCGSKEDEPMRWDPNIITKLQKGHMDPDKDLTEDNCIPQCGFCNQRYKDKAVFDKRGQVIKLK